VVGVVVGVVVVVVVAVVAGVAVGVVVAVAAGVGVAVAAGVVVAVGVAVEVAVAVNLIILTHRTAVDERFRSGRLLAISQGCKMYPETVQRKLAGLPPKMQEKENE